MSYLFRTGRVPQENIPRHQPLAAARYDDLHVREGSTPVPHVRAPRQQQTPICGPQPRWGTRKQIKSQDSGGGEHSVWIVPKSISGPNFGQRKGVAQG